MELIAGVIFLCGSAICTILYFGLGYLEHPLATQPHPPMQPTDLQLRTLEQVLVAQTRAMITECGVAPPAVAAMLLKQAAEIIGASPDPAQRERLLAVAMNQLREWATQAAQARNDVAR